MPDADAAVRASFERDQVDISFVDLDCWKNEIKDCLSEERENQWKDPAEELENGASIRKR